MRLIWSRNGAKRLPVGFDHGLIMFLPQIEQEFDLTNPIKTVPVQQFGFALKCQYCVQTLPNKPYVSR